MAPATRCSRRRGSWILLQRTALAGSTDPEMVGFGKLVCAPLPVNTCRILTLTSSRKTRDAASIKKVSSRKGPSSLWAAHPPPTGGGCHGEDFMRLVARWLLRLCKDAPFQLPQSCSVGRLCKVVGYPPVSAEAAMPTAQSVGTAQLRSAGLALPSAFREVEKPANADCHAHAAILVPH